MRQPTREKGLRKGLRRRESTITPALQATRNTSYSQCHKMPRIVTLFRDSTRSPPPARSAVDLHPNAILLYCLLPLIPPSQRPNSNAAGPANSSHIAVFSPQAAETSSSPSGIREAKIPKTFPRATIVPLRTGQRRVGLPLKDRVPPCARESQQPDDDQLHLER